MCYSSENSTGNKAAQKIADLLGVLVRGYKGPVSWEHLFKDVLTHYLLSNSPNDKTPFIDRVAGPEVGNQVRNFIEKWQEKFEKNISGMRKVLNDFYKLKIR